MTTSQFCNAVLFGNTKSAWPHFLCWLSSEVDRTRGAGEEEDDAACDIPVDDDGAALKRISNPFDSFIEMTIIRAMRQCCRRDDDDRSRIVGS